MEFDRVTGAVDIMGSIIGSFHTVNTPGPVSSRSAAAGIVRRFAGAAVSLVFLLSIPAGLSAADAKTEFPLDAAKTATLELTAPENREQRKYLGVQSSPTFTLGQVNADVLLIEVFSMYCPICQAEAARVNKVFEAIGKLPRGGKQVKMIGVGIGNTELEVELFRKKYNVLFPLVADPDFAIQRGSKQKFRTPTFIAFTRGAPAATKIHVGGIEDPGKFLASMIGK